MPFVLSIMKDATKNSIPSNLIPRPSLLRSLLLVSFALSACLGILTGCAPQPALSQPTRVTRQGPITPLKTPPGQEVATIAGGCFWAREAMFRQLKGVASVEPGYAGGRAANPSYEQVSTGTTGHTETVQIFFDPKVISYHDILDVFFHTHDPTTLNEQAPDVGTQYRSAVFYHSKAQKAMAEQVIHEIEKAHLYPNPIVTEVTPYTNFYEAEDYHRNYFALNPDVSYCKFVVAPEVAHFKSLYQARLK